MNQQNPAGNPTIFYDVFGFCIPCDLPQDSHFLFPSFGLTIPAGFSSESATSLRSVFAKSTPFGTSVPFVQLVIPDSVPAQIIFTGQIQTMVGSTVTDHNVAGIIPISEPSALGLAGLALGCGCACRRRAIK
jgi:hypothetical protein